MPDHLTPVSQLRPGDMVDLANDPFADPSGDNPIFECEYAVVCEVTPETPDCIAVSFEGWDTCGFPPDHLVSVGGHDAGYDQ